MTILEKKYKGRWLIKGILKKKKKKIKNGKKIWRPHFSGFDFVAKMRTWEIYVFLTEIQ